MSDTVTRTTLTLDITNAARGQELLVGLMAYIDDMMGLDYDSVAAQLDYVANYVRMKKYKESERQLYQQAGQLYQQAASNNRAKED